MQIPPPDPNALRFLDLACLVYSQEENPDRRVQAQALLDAHPDLPQADLSVACAVGAVEPLEALLRENPDWDVRTCRGPRNWPALLYLTYSRVLLPGGDSLRCARLLLDAGADPNSAYDNRGYHFTAFTGAVGEGEQGLTSQPPHPEAQALAELLLNAGARPNQAQALYNTMFSARDHWLELLLRHGLSPEDTLDWHNAQPNERTLDYLLLNAAHRGLLERVELLLQAGADANACAPGNGRAAHTQALLGGHAQVVKRLETAGARAAELSPAEALRLSISQTDREQTLKLTQANPALLTDPALLMDFAGSGPAAAVQLLLDLGVDANSRNGADPTALHRAAHAGHVASLEALLASGADPNIKDGRFQATPLGWARHAKQAAAIELLESL